MNPRTKQNLIALQTILRKETMRFFRIWSQTLLPPAITMTLYFIIFGKLIGSQIQQIHGHSYMQYIVPGLVMMSMMTNAYANTAGSFFTAKFNRSIEEMLVSSMPNSVILLGFMLGGALRGVVVGLIVLLIALLFTHLQISHYFLVIFLGIMATMVFSFAGLINGIYAKKFDDISFIPTFVLTPLTYLGGVFYSLTQLPPIWQKISVLNPIFSMVDAFRFAILGTGDLNKYWGVFTVSVLFVVLFLWSEWLIRKGVGIKS